MVIIQNQVEDSPPNSNVKLENDTSQRTSPSRIVSMASKIVSFVASPLRYAADSLAVITSDEEDDGMMIDDEISFRARRNSGGLVMNVPDNELSGSIDQFFTPAASMGASFAVEAPKNISQESVPKMSKSFSNENSKEIAKEFDPFGLIKFESPAKIGNSSTPSRPEPSLLDLDPICPLSPTSQPKYSERDINIVRQQLEERSERQIELLHFEINTLEEKYSTALAAGQEMKNLLTEYERSMAQIVEIRQQNVDQLSTLEQLNQDKRQLMVEMQAMQIAFANVKQRYEESKMMNEQLKLHEQGLKSNIQALQIDLQNADRRYEILRKHAEEKLSEANEEVHRLRTSLEIELSATKAKLHKTELKVTGLESSLEAKTRENTELMTICDELIQKIDLQAAAAGTNKSSSLLASLNNINKTPLTQ